MQEPDPEGGARGVDTGVGGEGLCGVEQRRGLAGIGDGGEALHQQEGIGAGADGGEVAGGVGLLHGIKLRGDFEFSPHCGENSN